MNAKTLLIIALFLLQEQSVLSQCISIELSVTWETGYDIFQKDSVVDIPKLNIIYRNNCTVDYYFLKVSESRDGLPKLPCVVLVHPSFRGPDESLRWHNNFFERAKESINDAKKYHGSKNENFHVIIGGEPLYINSWEVSRNTIDTFKNYSHDLINCDLSKVYNYIYYENNDEEKVIMKLCFESSDITPENITDSLKDKFVFVKSGATFIDIYNLIGFKLIEGCFTFYVHQNDIKNYVLNLQWDSVNKENMEQKLELPEVVGEYQRYSGAFNTNKVTVCFGNK